MRVQRGSSATAGGELRDWFDTLFMIVIAVFSYRCSPILVRTFASYTPILAFKSNIGHPIPAVAARMVLRSWRKPPLNACVVRNLSGDWPAS
jgi:hypothetical protein